MEGIGTWIMILCQKCLSHRLVSSNIDRERKIICLDCEHSKEASKIEWIDVKLYETKLVKYRVKNGHK